MPDRGGLESGGRDGAEDAMTVADVIALATARADLCERFLRSLPDVLPCDDELDEVNPPVDGVVRVCV